MTETGAPRPGPGGGADGSTVDGEPADREAVTDLLGLLAYAELTSFGRLARDARRAPTLADRAALAEMAAAEFEHFRLLRDHLAGLGVDPETAMTPFVAPLDAFHASTRPSTWVESLLKAFVADGIAADFYRQIAAFLDPATRDLVLAVLADAGLAAFAVERVRCAAADDPAVTGRLALWARRLVGEALTQAHQVAAERAALARFLEIVDGRADAGRMLARITDAHSARMAALGMSP